MLVEECIFLLNETGISLCVPGCSCKETKRNPWPDEEEKGKSRAGGPNISLALPDKFHFAQYRLLGFIWRSRPLVRLNWGWWAGYQYFLKYRQYRYIYLCGKYFMHHYMLTNHQSSSSTKIIMLISKKIKINDISTHSRWTHALLDSFFYWSNQKFWFMIFHCKQFCCFLIYHI